ncbi:pentapeptide repeat-containing protein [Actinomadura sp. KC216]|uniref:pentapeptide repeat-containing protein n=1 Tax=Actinomadura sp. KC216 TaxID=2530370 RepID=UPI00104AEBF4|nr:pentapeptide repeat-containing protein [Actinomadura sp. KC216]TDB83358.1 pentapeptide repeat-containing protein [Actinomadura sp. KC216]
MQRPKTSDVMATVLALGVLAAVWGALAWAPSDTARWLLGGIAVTAAAILTMWGLLGPAARWLSGERAELTAAERSALSPAERVEAVNHARSALMQSVTGLVVIAGVVFTAAGLLYTARTLDTTRQGQVTDRYTKAVEQLGSSKREVRIGAIYALERIAADSPRDHLTIRDVLAAFVREHDPGPHVKTSKLPKEPDTDVDAALIVLARRPADPPSSAPLDLHTIRVPNSRFPRTSNGETSVADLGGADLVLNSQFPRTIGANLRGADLTGADLRGADLTKADLRGADLTGADLTGATLTAATLTGATLNDATLSDAGLSGANLRGADLTDANLRDADLSYADLTGAYLPDADLTLANLSEANLTNAKLIEANLTVADLRGADLTKADLTKADLRGADLRGADLRGIRGDSAEQLRKMATTDTTTRF